MEDAVKLYGTATCPQCQGAKQYLAKRGIVFTYVDIAVDHAGMETVKKLGAMSLPVITYKDKVVAGFNVSKLNELIKEVH